MNRRHYENNKLCKLIHYQSSFVGAALVATVFVRELLLCLSTPHAAVAVAAVFVREFYFSNFQLRLRLLLYL